jgi:nucleotide-binding universal stress UspA family protein
MKKIKIHDILTPVSDLEEDKDVINKALRLAKKMKSSITFFHVRKGKLIPTQGLAFMERNEEDQFRLESIQQYLQQYKLENKIDITFEIVDHFDISEAISEKAPQFSLLVLGKHSKGLLSRLFGENTVEKVLGKVHVDVYVVNS